MSSRIIRYVCLLSAAFAAACSSGPGLSYEGHGGGGPEPDDGGHDDEQGIVSIAHLKTLYNLNPRKLTEDVSIRGVVVGNDWHSVFYKTLVVSDETGGIEVKVDIPSLQGKYKLGRTLTVRCNGLAIGSYGGLLQLGWPSPDPEYETGYIPAERAADHLVIDDDPEVPMVAPVVAIPELTAARLSTLVGFRDVQFVDEEVGKYYTENGADTDRHLTDAAGNRLIVRTNAHATFASYPLPRGNGYIEGVLGYFNGNYQLRIVNDLNILMNNPRISPALPSFY